MELMFRVCDVGSLPICSCLSENPSDRLISSGNPDNTSSESPSKWSSAADGESSLSAIVLIVAQSTSLYKIYYNRFACGGAYAGSVRRQALGDLARINRVTTMGELTASLAHEISQPISGAITNANVCLRKLGNDKPDLDEVRAAVTRFGRDARRAAEIIARIRSQFEKGSVNRETLGVSEMIRETVALLRDEATRYNISVRTELAADLPQIIGDRVQLQQVVMNLIVNSIEAMKDLDGLREMVIKAQLAENERILVSVSDTGPGFPPDRAEQIFDPFFTTKPHGTGMGLRISRSIVESHGGRLWAEAAAGRGATFHLNLPVAIPGHTPHAPESIIA